MTKCIGCKCCVVASVGPIMTEALEEAGLPVDIVPQHPKMAALVKAAAELAASAVERKRAIRTSAR